MTRTTLPAAVLAVLLLAAVPAVTRADGDPQEPCPATPAEDCITYDDFDESQARPMGPGMNETTLSGYGWAIRTGGTYQTSVGAALAAAEELIQRIINNQKEYIEAKGYTVYGFTPNYTKDAPEVTMNNGSMTAKVHFHGSTVFFFGNPSQ